MAKNLIIKTSGKVDKKVVYKVEKDFSINNVEMIKKELEEIIGKTPAFHLELRNIESFDLSSIQLLKAFSDKMGNDFSVSIDLKDDLKTIIQHAGFENYLIK